MGWPLCSGVKWQPDAEVCGGVRRPRSSLGEGCAGDLVWRWELVYCYGWMDGAGEMGCRGVVLGLDDEEEGCWRRRGHGARSFGLDGPRLCQGGRAGEGGCEVEEERKI